jgi:signal transduction histidine kinase
MVCSRTIKSIPHIRAMVMYGVWVVFSGMPCVVQSQQTMLEDLWNRAKGYDLISDSARYYLQKVIALASPTQVKTIEAEALHLLGKHYHLHGHNELAIANHQRALPLFVSLQNWERAGYCHIQLGLNYDMLNLLDSAALMYQEAISIYQQHQLQKDLWTPYLGLCDLYSKIGNPEAAFRYARLAGDALKYAGDKPSKVITYNRILRLARDQDSLGVYAEFSDKLYRLYSPLELDEKTLQHFNFYVHIRDSEERIAALHSAIQRWEQLPPVLERVSCYNQLAQAELESGNSKAAIQHWEYAIHLEEDSLQTIHFTPYILQSLSQQYESAGRPDLALKAFKQYAAIKDSLTQIYTRNKVEELQLQFETQEKDNALAQQQLVLVRRTLQRNIIIGLTLLLISGGVYIFYVQRRHIRDQKIIADQQQVLHQREIAELKKEHEIENLQTLITAQEEERRRIAMELHDSLGGLLATLKLQTRKFNEVYASDAMQLATTQHAQLIDSLSAEARRIAHSMMPPALIKMGLSAAIEDLVQMIHQDRRLEVSFQNIDFEGTMAQDREITLYRIIQELCANVIRHAEAKHLLIQLSRHNGSATLVVEDDGKGFDLNTERKEGLGLESIRSRVHYLDGEMEMWSSPGEGTSVTIHFPMT